MFSSRRRIYQVLSREGHRLINPNRRTLIGLPPRIGLPPNHRFDGGVTRYGYHLVDAINQSDGKDLRPVTAWLEHDPESVNVEIGYELPVEAACSRGLIEVVDLLLTKGAKLPSDILVDALACYDEKGYGICAQLIFLLRNHGACRDTRDNAKALCRSLDLKVNIQDHRSIIDKMSIINLLLQFPISWSYSDSAGCSLLQKALFTFIPAVDFFIENGANIRQILNGPLIKLNDEHNAKHSKETPATMKAYIELAKEADEEYKRESESYYQSILRIDRNGKKF